MGREEYVYKTVKKKKYSKNKDFYMTNTIFEVKVVLVNSVNCVNNKCAMYIDSEKQ